MPNGQLPLYSLQPSPTVGPADCFSIPNLPSRGGPWRPANACVLHGPAGVHTSMVKGGADRERSVEQCWQGGFGSGAGVRQQKGAAWAALEAGLANASRKQRRKAARLRNEGAGTPPGGLRAADRCVLPRAGGQRGTSTHRGCTAAPRAWTARLGCVPPAGAS